MIMCLLSGVFKSCLLSSMSSGLLVTSRCILSLSPALSCVDVIKDYYLSLRPRLRVLVPPCCVHRDNFGSTYNVVKYYNFIAIIASTSNCCLTYLLCLLN